MKERFYNGLVNTLDVTDPMVDYFAVESHLGILSENARYGSSHRNTFDGPVTPDYETSEYPSYVTFLPKRESDKLENQGYF